MQGSDNDIAFIHKTFEWNINEHDDIFVHRGKLNGIIFFVDFSNLREYITKKLRKIKILDYIAELWNPVRSAFSILGVFQNYWLHEKILLALFLFLFLKQ